MLADLFNRLSITTLDRGSLALPTDRTIQGFERNHFFLPEGYKEYAKLFGAGELFEYYQIAVPLGVKSRWDLEDFDRRMSGQPGREHWSGYASQATIAKMFFFGTTIGGDALAWNTKELEDMDTHEMLVYSFVKGGKLELIAKSFLEFVEVYCVNHGADKTVGFPPMTFVRY